MLQIFIYDFKWLTCQEGVNFSRQIEDILQPTLIKDELYALLLPTLNEEIKRLNNTIIARDL